MKDCGKKRAVAPMPLLFFLTMAFLTAGAGCNRRPVLTADDLVNRASAYLWSQQAPDGGWHSQTHGLLKGGQALTPFLLHTLLESHPDLRDNRDERVRRALDFIRRHAGEAGVVGVSDPMVMEYPNYSTAYALRVITQHGLPSDSSLIRRMMGYLIEQQFDSSRAVEAGHPAFGGWGFGEQPLPAGQVGHVDLSHTRRILQALRGVAADTLNLVFRNAEVFLAGLQNRALIGGPRAEYYDGGFHYSPVVFLANKGEVVQTAETSLFLSYATATCDGLLALHTIGSGQNEPAVRDALLWLERHPNLASPEGIPEENPAQWHRVMFYYHLAVRAEAYHLYGWPSGARAEMLHMLALRMREDGSYLNPMGAPNKENDPLLATALALSALHFIAANENVTPR